MSQDAGNVVGGRQMAPGLSYHFKAELEKNATLAGKGAADPYLPHVEVDVWFNPAEAGMDPLDVEAHRAKYREAMAAGLQEAGTALGNLLTLELAKDLRGGG
jgi:hypothetical protein